MTVIVDVSVAIKWVVDEAGSLAARRLVAEEQLSAPDLMFVECANVLRTKVRRGELAPILAREALRVIDAAPIRSIPGRPHVAAAQAIALELDRSVYDCLYLAIAIAEYAVMVTADARFAIAVQAHPVYAGHLKTLEG